MHGDKLASQVAGITVAIARTRGQSRTASGGVGTALVTPTQVTAD